MRPPTEEELNEEVEDGFGLDLYDQDFDLVKTNLEDRKLDLFVLEVTLEITRDRWILEKGRLEADIEFKESMLTVSQEYFDDEPDMAVQDQHALDAAKESAQEGRRRVPGRGEEDKRTDSSEKA
jgi:hypothetical protein